MRTLNRPMFRYGGPIKEGVMHGIREPKRNGGSMSQSVQPSSNGMRPGYKGIKSKLLSYVPGVNYVAGKTRGIIPRIINKMKPTFNKQPGIVTGGDASTKAKYMSQTMPKVPFMERAGAFVKENPYFTGAAAPFAVSGALTAAPPVAKGLAGLAESGVKQIGDLLVPDFIFDQDKYFADKEKAKLEKENTTTLNTDIKKLLEQPTKPKKSEKELRAEQIAKYRDIVDIKGMNKDAAYNSLIAASQAISEEGDFKGSIKDGSLINKLIQSTSKQFDKPQATKDAIDSLILKSQIQKDMNKDKDALDREYKQTAIDINKQKLDSSFQDNKLLAANAKLSGQAAFDAAAGKSSENFRGNIVPNSEWVEIKADIKKKGGGMDDITIIANWTNQTIKGKQVPNGDYTVGDALVTIEEGQVTNITR